MIFETDDVALSVDERVRLQRDLNPVDPSALFALAMSVPFFGVAAWALLEPNPICLPPEGWAVPARVLGFLCAGLTGMTALGLFALWTVTPLAKRAIRKQLASKTEPETYRVSFDGDSVVLAYSTGTRIDTPLPEARSLQVRDRRILILAGGRIACPVPERALHPEADRMAFESLFASLEPYVQGRGRRARRR